MKIFFSSAGKIFYCCWLDQLLNQSEDIFFLLKVWLLWVSCQVDDVFRFATIVVVIIVAFIVAAQIFFARFCWSQNVWDGACLIRSTSTIAARFKDIFEIACQELTWINLRPERASASLWFNAILSRVSFSPHSIRSWRIGLGTTRQVGIKSIWVRNDLSNNNSALLGG